MTLPISAELLAASCHLEGQRRDARGSFLAFVEQHVKDESGRPVTLADIHRSWHRHLSYCWGNGLKCMIMAHFGSGKSSAFACPLAAWVIGNNTQARIKFVCNGDAQARQRVASVKSLIESPRYRYTFPNVKPGAKWSAGELYVRRKGFSIDPSIQARGVMTKGIGGRADVILFDDVCDQLNSDQEASRTKVKSLVDSTWLSRLDQGGKVLWIATPWHENDATMALSRSPGWCTLIQRINEDFTQIEQEVLGGLPGIPYPVA